jgi:Spy/CpxP family protein refolding chaperone
MMAIRTDSDGKIQALLTDQQKQKYQSMQERMQQRRGERGQGQGGDNTPPPTSQPQPQ